MRRGNAAMQVRSKVNGLVSAPPQLVTGRSKTEDRFPPSGCRGRGAVTRLPGRSLGASRKTVGSDVARSHVFLLLFFVSQPHFGRARIPLLSP